jgi:hypothetical protein
LIHTVRIELEVMRGALDLYDAKLADHPEAALPKTDLVIARMLTRILETRSFLPEHTNLRHDL